MTGAREQFFTYLLVLLTAGTLMWGSYRGEEEGMRRCKHLKRKTDRQKGGKGVGKGGNLSSERVSPVELSLLLLLNTIIIAMVMVMVIINIKPRRRRRRAPLLLPLLNRRLDPFFLPFFPLFLKREIALQPSPDTFALVGWLVGWFACCCCVPPLGAHLPIAPLPPS